MNGLGIRKVFMATINYDHPQAGMRRAMEGIFGKENVAEYDFLERARQTRHGIETVNEEFVDRILEFQPDWAWLQLQNSEVIRPSTIRKVRDKLPRCVFTHWMGDARPVVEEYLAAICKTTHATFLASQGHIPLYIAAGAPEVHYLQIGLDWDEDIRQSPDFVPPYPIPAVLFIGNHYGKRFPGTPDREQAIQTLQNAGIDIGIVGNGWANQLYKYKKILGGCHVKEQVHFWKRAQVALSVNHFNDAAGYYSDRHLIAMASGTPVVCQRIPDLGSSFVDEKECMMFSTPEELVAKTKRLLEDAELRRSIGQAGRRRVLKEHTWYSRFLDALGRVSEIHEELAKVGAETGVARPSPVS